MRRLVVIAFLSLGVLASVAVAQRGERPSCIGVETEARFSGYAFRHTVTIENRCARTAVCTVSTDVNPQEQRVEVPRGETRDVITHSGSPASVFEAHVDCELR